MSVDHISNQILTGAFLRTKRSTLNKTNTSRFKAFFLNAIKLQRSVLIPRTLCPKASIDTMYKRVSDAALHMREHPDDDQQLREMYILKGLTRLVKTPEGIMILFTKTERIAASSKSEAAMIEEAMRIVGTTEHEIEYRRSLAESRTDKEPTVWSERLVLFCLRGSGKFDIQNLKLTPAEVEFAKSILKDHGVHGQVTQSSIRAVKID